jgi:hypothetical protein
VSLVVVGVALEAIVLIKEYRHDRRLYLRGTISSPAKPLIRDLLLSLIGAMLVAIGVAGELGIDFKASVIESQLRGKHGDLEALLNTEAGQSRSESGKAKERAGVAEQKAGEANGKAEAARLEQERLKAENLKLEAQIQPRDFSPSEQARIISLCRPFAGHMVDFLSQAFDLEGARLAYRLGAILEKAGIVSRTYDVAKDSLLSGPIFIDIQISGPQSEAELIKALTLSLATPRVLIAPIGVPIMHPGGGSVTIFVGAKRFPETAEPAKHK